MSRHSISSFITLVLLALIANTFAQTTTDISSSTPTASSTYNVFSDIASSTPQTSPNDPAFGTPNDNPETPNPDTAGASGSSQTAISLNTGDIIAIAVVVGLVVILGLASAVLFYLAKKRQWEVRASLRRSAKRFTMAVKAKTPIKPNFSRRDRAGVVRIDPPEGPAKIQNKNKRTGAILKEGRPKPQRINTSLNADVEKGFGTQTRIVALPRPSPPPSPPQASGLKSSFEMDSPLTGNQAGGKKGKGGWMKILGKK